MYIYHVSSEKQTPSEKRDKCKIMGFPHSATYTYMKREVIGFLETSVVVCRLHETSFQTTKIFIFTSMKTKYQTQKWNEFDFHDKTNVSRFIVTYDREFRNHVEREAVWAPTWTFTTSIVVCCQVVILLVIPAIYGIWGLTITLSGTTMKIQRSTSLVLQPQTKSTGLLVLQYCIPLVSK
jgi:hypothetical protein